MAADNVEFQLHGGRLRAAERAFPKGPKPWLDLSTGINPNAWPGPRAAAAALRRLPDPADLRELENIAAASFGCDPARVVATAGAEAAIRLLPSLLPEQRVAIASPTYSSHETAWRLAGATVDTGWEPGHGLPGGIGVIVNPNNPDGRRLPCRQLLQLAQTSGWLVVDESFVESAPELSVAGAAVENLVVLRSFGKFYGLPGVRLGFLIAPEAIATQARARLGDWPLSADAIAIGLGAYRDGDWARRERIRLARDAARLDDFLTHAGLTVIGGTSLFRLVAVARADAVFAHLARRGILVRPFDHRSTWLRFGLPGQAGWARLISALEELRA